MEIRVEEDGGTRTVEPDRHPVTVGRDLRNSVVLPSETVSAFHLELRVGNGVLLARDLGSSNGTVLADAQGKNTRLLSPHETTPLDPDDVLVLGGGESPVRLYPCLVGPETSSEADPRTVRATRPLSEVRLDRIDRGSWPKLLELNRGLMDADSLDDLLIAGLDGLLILVPRAVQATVFLSGDGGSASNHQVVRVVRKERKNAGLVDLDPDLFRNTLPGDSLVSRVINEKAGVLWEDKVLSRVSRTIACAPLWAGRTVLGALQVESARDGGHRIRETDLDKLVALAAPFALALRNVRKLADTRTDRNRLVVENTRLRTNLTERRKGPRLLGGSDPVEELRELISSVGPTPLPVLVTGETGTGKELVANCLHWQSKRRTRPFVACNAAAIPSSLMEAELFGVTRGAFTGAATDRPGLFEAANRGTLFLDEVAELTTAAQATLLRVLEEGEVRRLGETRTRKVDVRVLSATNRDLETAVAKGAFRQDLLFRINTVVVTVPPLRERRGDIPELTDHLLGLACAQQGREVPEILPEVRHILESCSWPGNVRQLGNEMSRALAVTDPGQPLSARSLSFDVVSRDDGIPSDGEAGQTDSLREALAAYEKEYVVTILAAHGGNRTHSAKALGITRAGLQKIIKRHGIQD